LQHPVFCDPFQYSSIYIYASYVASSFRFTNILADNITLLAQSPPKFQCIVELKWLSILILNMEHKIYLDNNFWAHEQFFAIETNFT